MLNTLQSSWRGELELRYSFRNNQTQLVHSKNIAPLKIQRPFYGQDKQICQTLILNTAGGVVGGDKLLQNLYLGEKTQVLINTPSAQKVYRSQGLEARQEINLHIEPGAFLQFLPQESIIFNGAYYRQHLKIELAPTATWLGWEITRFGRSARGERFITGKWSSATEVYQAGKPIWIDRQALWGNPKLIDSPNGLAGMTVVGTLAWISHPVSIDFLSQIRQLWSDSYTEAQIDVTRLLSGLVCRYRGNSTTEVKQLFEAVFDILPR